MTNVVHAPNTILMIRPAAFYPNPDTETCNSFQSKSLEISRHADLLVRAQEEFDLTADTLKSVGIDVRVIQDSAVPVKPDAVFPNNWFSTHGNGTVATYPMYSQSRRYERGLLRQVKERLIRDFNIEKTIDFSPHEQQGQILEGTGSLCIDHLSNTAFVGLSNRADEHLARMACAELGLETVLFSTADDEGNPVYHTNVILCIGTEFALFGTQMIPDLKERDALLQRLQQMGKTVIELTNRQITEFAGNAIELSAKSGQYLAISQRGADSLTKVQIRQIECFATLLCTPLPTIELSGGSMRCMIAGIHLPKH